MICTRRCCSFTSSWPRAFPKSHLVAALCRVLDEEEEAAARAYLEEAGYEVLDGSIPESITYRIAHNRGRSLTETDEQSFNDRADALDRGAAHESGRDHLRCRWDRRTNRYAQRRRCMSAAESRQVN